MYATTWNARSLIAHKNEDAFERYHRTTPYIEEFINVLGKTKNADWNETARGTTKLLKYLSKNHEKVFVEVAQSEGLSVSGVMDEVSAAAMWNDAQISKRASLKILRHLRTGLNAKIAVPYSQVKSLHAGFTVPSLGAIHYQHK